MLKIKLARFGKKNQPHYRIVVNEARSKRDGQYTDLIGHYAPAQEPKLLEINLELYKEWISKGAQPTDTVAALAARYESGNPFPEKKKKLSKKAKAKAAAEKEAAAAPAEEAPAEEAPETEATPDETAETAQADSEAEPTAEPTTEPANETEPEEAK